MRKLLMSTVIIGGVLLAGCGNDEEVVKEEKVEQTEPAEPTQAELDAKLKEEAVEADFVTINGDTPPELDTKVFLTGEVQSISEYDLGGELVSIMTKEGDGYGYYMIINGDPGTVEIGKNYKVYGSTTKIKHDDTLTLIYGDIIEEVE